MKRSVVSLILLFVSISAMAADSDRKHVVLDPSSARSAFPFSDAVLVGNTRENSDAGLSNSDG